MLNILFKLQIISQVPEFCCPVCFPEDIQSQFLEMTKTFERQKGKGHRGDWIPLHRGLGGWQGLRFLADSKER